MVIKPALMVSNSFLSEAPGYFTRGSISKVFFSIAGCLHSESISLSLVSTRVSESHFSGVPTNFGEVPVPGPFD